MGTFSPEEMNELRELIKLGFTPEQVVSLKGQRIEITGSPVDVAVNPIDGDDEKEFVERDADKLARLDAMVKDFLSETLEARHMEIFDWLCSAGKRPSDLCRELMRNAVIAHRPAWREAQGKGGGSSKSVETLAQRLTPVPVKD